MILSYVRALGQSGDSAIRTLYKLLDGQIEAQEEELAAQEELLTQLGVLIEEKTIDPEGDYTDLFFREGQTFNTIITRAAHGSYIYREVLSNYAFKQYPQYRGMFSSEEEDCCRVKAKLVDDMFARLLQELKEKGQLENTVIIGMTDHYTYGINDTQLVLDRFGFEPPKLIHDMYTQVRDLDFDTPPCLSTAVTVGRAWKNLQAQKNILKSL